MTASDDKPSVLELIDKYSPRDLVSEMIEMASKHEKAMDELLFKYHTLTMHHEDLSQSYFEFREEVFKRDNIQPWKYEARGHSDYVLHMDAMSYGVTISMKPKTFTFMSPESYYEDHNQSKMYKHHVEYMKRAVQEEIGKHVEEVMEKLYKKEKK
jgi:hypothetical protein